MCPMELCHIQAWSANQQLPKLYPLTSHRKENSRILAASISSMNVVEGLGFLKAIGTWSTGPLESKETASSELVI